MKLRALYSSDSRRFPRIDFRDGLNVVFARVRDPSVPDQDSHNLGKTFLIRVLDFVLLGSIRGNHVFRTRKDLFGDLVFYLEVKAESGAHVTIRRPVTGRAAICIHVSERPGIDMRQVPNEDWRHANLAVPKAIETLNRILNLTQIGPTYGYRKGLGYVMRDQSDYTNEFLISKFSRGKDVDWKPFVALILGFDNDLILEKYGNDRLQTTTRAELDELRQSHLGVPEEIDELRGVIGVRERDIAIMRAQVASFDFADIESEITRHTVRDLERRIAESNELRLLHEREAQEIDRALETEFAFDLDGITSAFAEAETTLPDLLVRSYEELVDFNERMSAERRDRLVERRTQLRNMIEETDEQRRVLNGERVESLKILTQRETLRKFESLQRQLLRKEEELLELRQRLSELGEAGRLAAELRRIEREQLSLITRIIDMVDEPNTRYERIRTLFSQFANDILGVSAILATRVNTVGNLEFGTRILEEGELSRETAEAEGTSYKKALCVCIDLALLVAHAGEGFYQFVYHDGIFEGFDNRRKVSLLDTVRRLCREFELQYILTVIDADLPRDERDNKVLFTEDEVVRELHDQGDAGRLFRMEAF